MKLYIPLRPGREAVIEISVSGSPHSLVAGQLTGGELFEVLRQLRRGVLIGDPTCRVSTESSLLNAEGDR